MLRTERCVPLSTTQAKDGGAQDELPLRAPRLQQAGRLVRHLPVDPSWPKHQRGGRAGMLTVRFVLLLLYSYSTAPDA